MKLLHLKIRHFQQHKSLDIDFNENVNFIVGPSGCGKSTVLRAINFLLNNEPHNESIRPDKISDKKRAEPTSVTGVFDNGYTVEHIKSASINRYVVTKDGKELTYDSNGVAVPEDIKTIFGNSYFVVDKEELNLNFAEQISLPFLYDKTASFRHKLFNRLTGADLIDRVLQVFNKSILQLGRDIKVCQEFVTKNTPILNDVTLQHTEKSSLYGKAKLRFDKINVDNTRLELFKSLKNKVETSNKSLSDTKDALKGVAIASEATLKALKDQIGRFTCLDTIKASIGRLNEENKVLLNKNVKILPQEVIDKAKAKVERHFDLEDIKGAYDNNRENINRVSQEINSIKMVSVDLENVKGRIQKYELLKTIIFSAQQKNIERESISRDIVLKEKTIVDLTNKYKDTLKEAGVCPICKQSTCGEHNV